MRGFAFTSQLSSNQSSRRTTGNGLSCLAAVRTLVCCLSTLLVCCSTVWAQVPTQFRSPEIPALRSVGGQLISNPTTPQTQLRSLQQPAAQTNQLRSGAGSEFPEYQFGDSSAGQFEELTSRGSIQETGNQTGLNLGSGSLSPPPPEDPNFDGFTPRSFRSSVLENQIDGGAGFSEGGQGSSVEAGQFEDTLEQLPPAMNETQSDADGPEKIIQRFPNGKKRIVRTVAQDKSGNFTNHGPWEAFDLKGNSVAAGVFKRGVLQGQWRRQHSQTEGGLFATSPFNQFQGPYLSVANFKDGKLDGLWTIYDRFRSKIFEISYVKGVRDGTATWWYPNRAKMREATFKNGLLHGKILGWDDAEKLTRREEYVEGRRIVRNVTFYRPEKPKQEEYYLDSKLEPEGEDNWWDAKPTPYLPRGSKVQNGGAAQWYENGQLKHQGQFKEDVAVGRFVWWHSNGNKSIQGMYADGKKTRTWTWWHENGMKKTEGTYQDDQAVGVWRAWYDDGSLRNEEDFSLGSPDSNDSESTDQETLDDEGPNEESALQPGTGQSVIESDPDFESGAELPEMEEIEELPAPQEQPTEGMFREPKVLKDNQVESDSTDEIEGYDFGNQKPDDVDSESFRKPIDPRDIDPFGEISPEGDGSIPAEDFDQPESNLFRPPGDPNQTPKSEPASDPFGGQLFQPPRTRDLTTEKPKSSPPFLKR